MTTLSSPPPSPLLARSSSGGSSSSSHHLHMPLSVSNVANLFVKMRRHRAKAKAHHIESASGDAPQTHPSLEGAASTERIPLEKNETFVCRDGVDATKLLRAVRGALYEKAQTVGANVLVDERYVPPGQRNRHHQRPRSLRARNLPLRRRDRHPTRYWTPSPSWRPPTRHCTCRPAPNAAPVTRNHPEHPSRQAPVHRRQLDPPCRRRSPADGISSRGKTVVRSRRERSLGNSDASSTVRAQPPLMHHKPIDRGRESRQWHCRAVISIDNSRISYLCCLIRYRGPGMGLLRTS
ncbi:hypothetical protein NUW54_g7749 [Trametes sanguinea]|uniref:Uncharacterized protein n=1 Tax=Trametes sanguinea TaxID=158606 RepID=A0ACC1PIR2_9APHY|nr:hypothetical protein NUW54_g7749 [Trametes sanguinea]